METLLIIVITAGITWAILYEFAYRPKAQIKHLWKVIHRYDLVDGSRNTDGAVQMALSPFKKRKDKIGNLINALLAVCWDEDIEEDCEYIKKNKYP